MMLDSETIHLASRHLMATGFAIALFANAWRKNWGYVAVLLLAIVETYARYRFELHTWARDELVGVHAQVGAKEVLQSKLIYVAVMLVGAVLLVLLPHLVRTNPGRRLMALGSLTALGMLGLELISPHYIDRIIYHTVVFFALAAVVYFVGGLLIALGAILDRRPQPSDPGSTIDPPREPA